MAGTSTERVRITGETGTTVASVDAKGVKNAIATYLVDASGNQIDSFSEPTQTIVTFDNEAGDVEYVGYALPGTATSDAGWLIGHITYSAGGNPSIAWAEGSEAMDKVLDDKATYNYS